MSSSRGTGSSSSSTSSTTSMLKGFSIVDNTTPVTPPPPVRPTPRKKGIAVRRRKASPPTPAVPAPRSAQSSRTLGGESKASDPRLTLSMRNLNNAHTTALERKLANGGLDMDFVVVDHDNTATAHEAPSSAPRPLKHQSTNALTTESTVRSHSFHETQLVYEQTPSGRMLRYFKSNPPQSLMSELEALAVANFRHIAPDHFPAARAHFHEQEGYVGVSSQAIEDFKSLKEDPFTERDLANDDIVRNLAITLTTSYIFQEDDLHRGNLSKERRIDGDGLLWPILHQFKASGVVDRWTRTPTATTYKVTARDIRNLPFLQDAQPAYWCTSAAPLISESARSLLKSMGAPMSANAYSEQENAVFKKLTNHPVFIYHKFKTLLKFLLTDVDMYRKINTMHLRENIMFGDQPLCEVLAQHVQERIEEFRVVLMAMPEFKAFITTNGRKALAEIVSEFQRENASLAAEAREATTKLRTSDSSEHDHLQRSQASLLARTVNTAEIQQRYTAIASELLTTTNAPADEGFTMVPSRS